MIEAHAILFDLDGTLVDSTSCVEAVWSAWAMEHSIDREALLSEVHGCRGLEIIPRFKPELDVLAENEKLLRLELEHASDVCVIPGAIPLLQALGNLPWGIVTMSTRELALAKLSATGLPVPEILITAEDVSKGKPDPESYLLGASKLAVDPSQCLVFEDAASGIQSANTAGMQVVQVMFSGHTDIQPNTASHIKDMTSVSIQAKHRQLTVTF